MSNNNMSTKDISKQHLHSMFYDLVVKYIIYIQYRLNGIIRFNSFLSELQSGLLQ